MPLMQHLGLPDGTVRASLYLYNTREEIQTLITGGQGDRGRYLIDPSFLAVVTVRIS